ncbi:homoserine acetyltransferase [Uncinocarpus reesii 1704]|uniref:Homoserine acetyltransferase n=1 Tax=Uncinocarpus reesii (strain UAMH 1704) TaxID=336963 RepID=C4JY13_UNCRE|nr:homoserine acetyltransferase [Uncinocarpus reesii 1704]EEP82199.1 homoserine acetyltransferase [Uncinocarpus reesii 1704]
MAFNDEYETFALGDWSLQSGDIIPNAHIAFKTFGDPKSPAIVYPTWYSGLISHNFWLVGDDKLLNPANYFIIIPALFGNGQSSSPSNTGIRPFPRVSFYDNVKAQYELVTKHFNIKHLRAVVGWSMGAGQSFQWASQYPNFMDLIVPFCGSAKTSLHNQVFLEGLKSTLFSSKRFISSLSAANGQALDGGSYRQWTPDEREAGLKAFGRVYAGWGFSQAFYRERLYETTLGYKDLEDFMVNFWERHFAPKDPDDLLVMLDTWQKGDISQQAPYNGNFEMALKGIKARALILPGKTDLYFPLGGRTWR